MKIITVNIADKHNIAIERFVEWGLYPSKSECFRKMVELGIPILEREIAFIEEMIIKRDIINIRQYMEANGFRIITNIQHKEKYDEIRKKKRPPLGNPFWELSINEEEEICYRNKEDQNIKIPLSNGRLD